MKCNNCGNEIINGAKFCNKCGTQINEKKQKNNVIIYIIIAIICLLVGCCIGFFIGKKIGTSTKDKECIKLVNEEKDKCKENDDSYDFPETVTNKIDLSNVKVIYENEDAKSLEIVDKILIDDYSGPSANLKMLLKNNSNKSLKITAYLNFMNSDNQRIDRALDSGYLPIGKGKYSVLTIANRAKEDYSYVTISIRAEEDENYHSLNITEKDIKIIETAKEIELYYTNNMDKEVKIVGTMLFYKDDKLIHYQELTLTGVKPGNTEKVNAYLSSLPTYDYKASNKDMYDKYEFVLAGAYYYETDY
jgi:predicted nucleic acid-binding Zn ribbon protein